MSGEYNTPKVIAVGDGFVMLGLIKPIKPIAPELDSTIHSRLMWITRNK